MRMKKAMAFAGVLFLLGLSLSGCAKKDNSDALTGSWAYVHDTEKAVLVLKPNGKATFNGDKYSYSHDDNFIKLESKDDSQSYRYLLKGEKEMEFYQKTTYEFAGTGKPEGLEGRWVNEESNWEFEFASEGTFSEDGYFHGVYSLDEENGVIKLMYNDHFYDTICYYKIEGNSLIVEYPWPMVKIK